jgi:hypothetical protein
MEKCVGSWQTDRPATHFSVKLGPVYGLRIRLISQTQTSLQYGHGHNVRIDRRQTPIVFKAGTVKSVCTAYTARSNEMLGWEGVGNRQLLCFFKA